MFNKLLSFLLPIKLGSYESTYSGTVSINLLNGKKILDTHFSNYSYGSLQRIFQKALQQLPFDNTIKNILVLGMGAGSIVETIRKYFHSHAFITLIEIDEVIISIAKNEFGLSQYHNIEIIHADAADFVINNTASFDLIIVDLFIIDTIPASCTTPIFIQALCNRMAMNGKLVYNTMRDTLSKNVFTKIIQEMNQQCIETRILKKLEGDNDIILGKKKR